MRTSSGGNFRVENRTRGLSVAGSVAKADKFVARAVGLLNRNGLSSEEGLWIAPCAMIHTFFMAFPIDAVFLDSQNRVVKVLRNLKPWRRSPWVWRAKGVLELAAERTEGRVFAGDFLEFK